jgi:hypothetical protein
MCLAKPPVTRTDESLARWNLWFPRSEGNVRLPFRRSTDKLNELHLIGCGTDHRASQPDIRFPLYAVSRWLRHKRMFYKVFSLQYVNSLLREIPVLKLVRINLAAGQFIEAGQKSFLQRSLNNERFFLMINKAGADNVLNHFFSLRFGCFRSGIKSSGLKIF